MTAGAEASGWLTPSAAEAAPLRIATERELGHSLAARAANIKTHLAGLDSPAFALNGVCIMTSKPWYVAAAKVTRKQRKVDAQRGLTFSMADFHSSSCQP